MVVVDSIDVVRTVPPTVDVEVIVPVLRAESRIVDVEVMTSVLLTTPTTVSVEVSVSVLLTRPRTVSVDVRVSVLLTRPMVVAVEVTVSVPVTTPTVVAVEVTRSWVVIVATVVPVTVTLRTRVSVPTTVVTNCTDRVTSCTVLVRAVSVTRTKRTRVMRLVRVASQLQSQKSKHWPGGQHASCWATQPQKVSLRAGAAVMRACTRGGGEGRPVDGVLLEDCASRVWIGGEGGRLTLFFFIFVGPLD